MNRIDEVLNFNQVLRLNLAILMDLPCDRRAKYGYFDAFGKGSKCAEVVCD